MLEQRKVGLSMHAALFFFTVKSLLNSGIGSQAPSMSCLPPILVLLLPSLPYYNLLHNTQSQSHA